MNEVVEHGAKEAGISISLLCERVGMSRQNYYAARRQRKRRRIDEDLVLELVRTERRVQHGSERESSCLCFSPS